MKLEKPPEPDNLSPETRLKRDQANEKEISYRQNLFRLTAQPKVEPRIWNRYPRPKRTVHKLLNGTEKTVCISKQINILSGETKELDTKLTVAYGVTHVRDYDAKLRLVERHVDCQKRLKEAIENGKLEVSNLKSQLARLDRAEHEVALVSVSDLQYEVRLKKARRGLEIVENQLQVAKVREGSLNAENNRLNGIIQTMLHDRALFNKTWSQMIKQLKHDRGFLVDMIERSILAFNQQETAVHQIDGLQRQAEIDFQNHASQMVHMRQQQAADELYHSFFRVKGKQREMAPLEEREVQRRRAVKKDTGNKLDLYNKILTKVFEQFLSDEKTGALGDDEISRKESLVRIRGETDLEYERRVMTQRLELEQKVAQRRVLKNLQLVIEDYSRNEANHFSQFKHLSYISHLIELISHKLDGTHLRISISRNSSGIHKADTISQLQFSIKEIELQKKETLRKQKQWNEYETKLNSQLNIINNIFTTLNCDRRLITSLLGNHNQVTTFNIKLFLSSLENCINAILGRIYHIESQSGTLDQQKFVKVPVKRRAAPVQVRQVIKNQQCSECAEMNDVNRYDETVFYPQQMQNIREQVKDKVVAPEIQYRLHTLSQCRLPRSRLLVNQRYK